jgi:hypothetical protein
MRDFTKMCGTSGAGENQLTGMVRPCPRHLTVRCPACCASVGRPCRNKKGETISSVHYMRAHASDLIEMGRSV